MNKNAYFALWGGLFILCAGLGFIPEPAGAVKWLLVVLAVVFFIPPALLIRAAAREKDTVTLKLVRDLSALSLGLTVAAIIGNFLTLMASEAAGNALYIILIIVSTPMVCGQYWLLSLFLWAFLMLFCISKLGWKKTK